MKIRHFVMLLSALFCGNVLSAEPPPTTPFSLIGYIQSFKLCDPTYNDATCNPKDPRAAATMKVNGITVIIPENLKIIMPGTYLTAQDIFKGPKGTATGALLTESGLALDDPHPTGKPFIPFTAEISGNIAKINPANPSCTPRMTPQCRTEYIAGLVNISQGVLQTSSGYIRKIDYAKAELLVAPDINNETNQVRVRLNDPHLKQGGAGRFSKGLSDDNRFQVDQGNPTVHAMTGYPVCIPTDAKGDPRCPMFNRPKDNKGVFLGRYTMGSKSTPKDINPKKSTPVTGTVLCSECNSNFLAPLVKGDYVIFSGIWIDDTPPNAPKTGYISAYALEANLGIYTSPGTDPAYVAIEESHWGTGGIPFDDMPQETGPGKPAPLPTDRILIPGQNLVTRFFVVGATTDPSRNIEIIALDVDPDTGKEKEPRVLATIAPEPTAPLGRFRRTVEQSVFLPPTREIKAHIAETTSEEGKKPEIANGLEWGQYTAPVGEYLFPEGRNWGSPEVPMNFENLCFLANGAGPLDTLGRDDAPGAGCIEAKCALGQLKPWPDSGHLVTDPRAAGFCEKSFTFNGSQPR